jgi:hypothetical protein
VQEEEVSFGFMDVSIAELEGSAEIHRGKIVFEVGSKIRFA